MRKIEYTWETGSSKISDSDHKVVKAIYYETFSKNKKTYVFYDEDFISDEDAEKIVRVVARSVLFSLLSSKKSSKKFYEKAYNLIKY